MVRLATLSPPPPSPPLVMNSKRLCATTAAIFALTAFGPHSSGVWAQTEQAECPTGWDWNKNSLGQDPCHVSSMLDAECRGIAIYTIPPLNATQNYVPPQQDSATDLKCDCDSVMYNLYMACSTCQGGRIYAWTRWMAQCDSVYVTQYPHDLPQGTAVPRWAFVNVTTLPDQTYSDSTAISIGRDPEQKPKAVNTVSGGKSSTGTRRPTNSPAPRPTNSGGGGGKKNVGAIVGGVVGGLAVLLSFVAGVFWYVKRGKQGGGSQPPPPRPLSEVSEYYKGQPISPVLGPTSPTAPYSPYYNPSDPSTYPPPMGDGHSSVSYSNPLSPVHGTGQGRYAGIPEV